MSYSFHLIAGVVRVLYLLLLVINDFIPAESKHKSKARKLSLILLLLLKSIQLIDFFG